VKRWVTGAALALLMSVYAGADGWLEDYDAALKASVATGKPILVDITGSDWCPPCQQMEAEVFGRPEFLPTASAQYVLLRLDYPRNLAQSEKIRVQNQRLADRYPFEGFPTYLLLDGQGRLFGQYTGYLPGGLKAFFQKTKQLEGQKDTLLGLITSASKAAPGAERAKAQDALYRQAEAWNLTSQYADLPLKIVQEDKDGKAGLKGRYQVLNAYNRLLTTWTEKSDFRQAAADLEALATQATPYADLRQKVLFTEGMVWMNAVGDELKAKDALTRAKAVDPTSSTGRRAAQLLDQLP